MLTDAKVKSLKIEDGKRHADRDGLTLEIRSKGKKAFIFRFQWNKKPQTMTLGAYPCLSLAEARAMVSTYRDRELARLAISSSHADKWQLSPKQQEYTSPYMI